MWKTGKTPPPPPPKNPLKQNQANNQPSLAPPPHSILLKDVEIWAIYLRGTLENEVGVGVERICLPDLQKCNTAGLFNTLSKHPYSFNSER